MSKKRILFVVSQLSTGGAERVISILASYFASKGHPVYVILFRKKKNTYELHESVKTILLKEPSNKLMKLMSRIMFIRRFIKENNIDAYITFEHFYGITCSFGNRVNYITSMRNDPNNDKVSKIERMVRYLNFRFSKHVVFQTEEIKGYFSNTIQKHGVIIKNPINELLPEYHGLRDKEIVAVCRLEPQKNIPMMLKAFKEFQITHSEYQLKIYGDGALREEVEKLINQMDLENSVHLMGFQKSIAEKIKKAAIYVCSSDYEGLSNSMLEAMAIGVPVVTTDSSGGGAREVIIDGENGFLVPVGDYKAMADKMSRVVDEQNISQQFSENSVTIRKVLSESEICKEWFKIL